MLLRLGVWRRWEARVGVGSWSGALTPVRATSGYQGTDLGAKLTLRSAPVGWQLSIIPAVAWARDAWAPHTGSRRGRPVGPNFLWWTDLSEASFLQRLNDPDLTVRAYWLGALLREANTRDVWRYTTPPTMRAMWPQVVRHLGRTRGMWAWLLRIGPGDEAWPPSTVA